MKERVRVKYIQSVGRELAEFIRGCTALSYIWCFIVGYLAQHKCSEVNISSAAAHGPGLRPAAYACAGTSAGLAAAATLGIAAVRSQTR